MFDSIEAIPFQETLIGNFVKGFEWDNHNYDNIFLLIVLLKQIACRI